MSCRDQVIAPDDRRVLEVAPLALTVHQPEPLFMGCRSATRWCREFYNAREALVTHGIQGVARFRDASVATVILV